MPTLDNMANANAAGQADLEAKVDDLSKPGNEEALNKALNDDFSQTEDPAQEDPKEEKPEADPEPEGDNPDEEDGEGDGDDPSQDNKDTNKDDKQPSKKDKVKSLLADRNEAREARAEAELENAAKDKKITDLEAENARLKSGDEGDGDEDPSADKQSLDDLIKKGVEKALGDRDNATAAEKSDIAEVEALRTNKNTPDSKSYEADIKDAMTSHPTLSAYAAYRMLQGEGIIPTDTASVNSNADKLNTGSQPKNNLIKDKNPDDMSTTELEAHIKKEQAAGRIKI